MTKKSNKSARTIFKLLRIFTPLSKPLYTEKIAIVVMKAIIKVCVDKVLGRSKR